MMDFAGRTVLITGAGGALARATAVVLAKQGADLVLADIDQESLDRTLALCPRSRGRCLDVTVAAEVQALADYAREAFDRPVYGLVGAAGMLGPVKKLMDVTEEEYDMTFSLNTRALWLLCRAVLPQMQAAKEGSVVLLSSTAGLEASRSLNLYSVTKAAVIMLSRNLALNHAADNIRINSICPGTIEGPMTDRSIALPGLDEKARQDRRKNVIAAHPMGRLGTPEEVAQSIVFLLSDMARFTTGVALPVDGGRLA